MAELTPKERLQPALLDRLTDDAPDQQVESRDDRIVSLRRLRQSVVRDLEWLFNTGALFAPGDQEQQDIVATSVINYGIPNLAGVQASGLSLPRLERLLRDAIWNFEPRLLRQSVRVKAVASEAMSHRAITFEITAQLWAQPLPLELFLRTEIDLESGSVSVADSGREGTG
ncbi:MAG TPA: type VI secretion system baseplate subunit TssE [Planctomycetota bacterium]|nr:type VI secretion system baseplate subunit TssE [Planctomycetota bacterium]